ncbi:MAG: hypothetical protein K0U16_07785 [Gammaproteobacteria bacterium]|nr:hypothetical protein [Gammaproteobacteria bacterium]
MTKLLFLDIDGVLNHAQWFQARGRIKGRSRAFFTYLQSSVDPECLERVNLITELTGAKIVLSSSWRYLAEWEEIYEGFTELGMSGTMVGCTPRNKEINPAVFEHYEGRFPAEDEPYPRGYEIQQWIDAQGYALAPTVAILDDDADMAHLIPRLVQTDAARHGLQFGHAMRAVNLLNGG